jgi:hypothetical protein
VELFQPLKNSRKNSKWSCSQFYNLNSVGVGSGTNGRSCLEGSTLAPYQVSIFLDIGMVFVLYFEIRAKFE